MAQAVRPPSRSRPSTNALSRAPPLKTSFNAYEQEAPAMARKDSKEAYKGQSMSEKVRVLGGDLTAGFRMDFVCN